MVVAERELPFELTPGRIRLLCDRSAGVGGDGVMLVSRATGPRHAARLRVYNPDGSEDELSGNGTAQAAAYLRGRAGHDGEMDLETAAGIVRAEPQAGGDWTIRLGTAALESRDYPTGPPDGRGVLAVAGDELRFRHVFVGNPQCAVEVDAPLEQVPVGAYGPAIEAHELFPRRTNVSFWRAESADAISVRIYERGVGETLSSGSGACGAAVAACLNGVRPPVTVRLPGGSIEVDVDEHMGLSLRTRPRRVFAGTLSDELVERLAELG